MTNNIENIPLPNYITQEISKAVIPSSCFLSLPSHCVSLPNRLLLSTSIYSAQSQGSLSQSKARLRQNHLFLLSGHVFLFLPCKDTRVTSNPITRWFRKRKTNHHCVGSFVLPQILTFEKSCWTWEMVLQQRGKNQEVMFLLKTGQYFKRPQ